MKSGHLKIGVRFYSFFIHISYDDNYLAEASSTDDD